MGEALVKLQDGYYIPQVAERGMYEIIDRVTSDTLKAGDVIPFGGSCWVITCVRVHARDTTLDYQLIDSIGHAETNTYTCRSNAGWINVARPQAAVPKHCTDQQVVMKKDSPWNGSCPRCGKGTYTGAFKMEHEDGACP